MVLDLQYRFLNHRNWFGFIERRLRCILRYKVKLRCCWNNRNDVRLRLLNQIGKAELEEANKAAAEAKAKEFEGWTSKEVMKMPWFWIFSIGFLIIGIGLASLNEDYAAFLDTKLSFGVVGTIGMMYGFGCLI